MPSLHFQLVVTESPSPFWVWSVITRALLANIHQLRAGKKRKNCKTDIIVSTRSLV